MSRLSCYPGPRGPLLPPSGWSWSTRLSYTSISMQRPQYLPACSFQSVKASGHPIEVCIFWNRKLHFLTKYLKTITLSMNQDRERVLCTNRYFCSACWIKYWNCNNIWNYQPYCCCTRILSLICTQTSHYVIKDNHINFLDINGIRGWHTSPMQWAGHLFIKGTPMQTLIQNLEDAVEQMARNGDAPRRQWLITSTVSGTSTEIVIVQESLWKINLQWPPKRRLLLLLARCHVLCHRVVWRRQKLTTRSQALSAIGQIV